MEMEPCLNRAKQALLICGSKDGRGRVTPEAKGSMALGHACSRRIDIESIAPCTMHHDAAAGVIADRRKRRQLCGGYVCHTRHKEASNDIRVIVFSKQRSIASSDRSIARDDETHAGKGVEKGARINANLAESSQVCVDQLPPRLGFSSGRGVFVNVDVHTCVCLPVCPVWDLVGDGCQASSSSWEAVCVFSIRSATNHQSRRKAPTDVGLRQNI